MPDADPPELRQGSRSHHSLTRIGILSILIGIIANGFAANVPYALLAHPDGARIRPMAEPIAIACAAMLGACGAALASVPIRERSTRWIGLVGFILGLTPLPLGLVLMDAVIRTRHLIILP